MRVLYFSTAARIAGCHEETWHPASSMTLERFWSEALGRHPGLAELCDSARVAVNQEYAEASTVIDPDAEVAIIPPVSGG